MNYGGKMNKKVSGGDAATMVSECAQIHAESAVRAYAHNDCFVALRSIEDINGLDLKKSVLDTVLSTPHRGFTVFQAATLRRDVEGVKRLLDMRPQQADVALRFCIRADFEEGALAVLPRIIAEPGRKDSYSSYIHLGFSRGPAMGTAIFAGLSQHGAEFRWSYGRGEKDEDQGVTPVQAAAMLGAAWGNGLVGGVSPNRRKFPHDGSTDRL